MSKKTEEYGSWKSPITADLIVEGTVGLGGLTWDGDNIYWTEGRSSEAGRSVIVRLTPDNQLSDVTPQSFNIRTRVHEYGGGSYIVNQGTVYFFHAFKLSSTFGCEDVRCRTKIVGRTAGIFGLE